MRSRQSRLVIRTVWRLATAVSLSIAATSMSTAAQQPPLRGAPSPGSANPKLETRERQEREARLRSGEMLTRKPENDRQVAAAVEQLRQDFKQIQVLRNEIVKHISGDGWPNYKTISDKTGEVNKRANRLKTFLMPQTPEEEKKERKDEAELKEEQIKPALVTLCKRIDSFTENPVFKLPGVVNVEESAKASNDLIRIIQLSDDIKKSAERLNKTKQ